MRQTEKEIEIIVQRGSCREAKNKVKSGVEDGVVLKIKERERERKREREIKRVIDK